MRRALVAVLALVVCTSSLPRARGASVPIRADLTGSGARFVRAEPVALTEIGRSADRVTYAGTYRLSVVEQLARGSDWSLQASVAFVTVDGRRVVPIASTLPTTTLLHGGDEDPARIYARALAASGPFTVAVPAGAAGAAVATLGVTLVQ
jgi:hypothetical protein